jgi:hypothetical protein
MLAQIAEEPEFDEADRSIGNYEFHDEEWESWKVGPDEYEDEYEDGSDSDGTQSTRIPKPSLGRHGNKKPSKPRKGKTKAATGRSKKRCQDLDSDDTELDSGSESEVVEGEHVVSLDVRALILPICQISHIKLISPARERIFARLLLNQARPNGPILKRTLRKY